MTSPSKQTPAQQAAALLEELLLADFIPSEMQGSARRLMRFFDGPTARVHATLPAKLSADLKAHAIKAGKEPQDIIRKAVRDLIRKEGF
jgi:hypothetical protein